MFDQIKHTETVPGTVSRKSSSSAALKRRQTIPDYRPRSFAARQFVRQSRSAGAFGELSRAVPPAFSFLSPNAGGIPALLDATACHLPSKIKAKKSSKVSLKIPPFGPLRYLLFKSSSSSNKKSSSLASFAPWRFKIFLFHRSLTTLPRLHARPASKRTRSLHGLCRGLTCGAGFVRFRA